MRAEGASDKEARRAVVMLDSYGLVFEGRDHLDDDKLPFALSAPELSHYAFEPRDHYDLEAVVRQVAPTVLVGTSGTPGTFTEGAVREMASGTEAPVILPLSNPTMNSEAVPADLLAWTGGRALVATGSPFSPVEINGRRRLVGQANNVFVFPGVGLGAIVARAREVTDRMFLVAATVLADMVPADLLDQGALYPPLSDLRLISRMIAIAVAREARDQGVGRIMTDAEITAAVDGAMWMPAYTAERGAGLGPGPADRLLFESEI
jgi:malic enzyme